jgi:hypothetical protein
MKVKRKEGITKMINKEKEIRGEKDKRRGEW